MACNGLWWSFKLDRKVLNPHAKSSQLVYWRKTWWARWIIISVSPSQHHQLLSPIHLHSRPREISLPFPSLLLSFPISIYLSSISLSVYPLSHSCRSFYKTFTLHPFAFSICQCSLAFVASYETQGNWMQNLIMLLICVIYEVMANVILWTRHWSKILEPWIHLSITFIA